MALKSNKEMAEMYQQAISQLVSGGVASYTIAGRTFTKLQLGELEKAFRYYKDAADADEGKGGFVVTLADFRGPR
jgi:hypothetical protein